MTETEMKEVINDKVVDIAELEAENKKLKEIVNDYDTLITSIMPQMGGIAIDVGLLNDTLIKASPYLERD